MTKKWLLLAVGIGVTVLLGGSRVHDPASRDHGVRSTIRGAGETVAQVGSKIAGVVREVTAYNVGVRAQTSDTPCIGASGRNLCELVERGVKVCAANFAPIGTVLEIEDHGECVVLDRTHRRYAHRVDIAMRADEVEEALEFGVRKRLVVLKD